MQWMEEGEIKSFIKVWVSAYLSLCYCYLVGKMFRNSAARITTLIPVVALYLLLPLQLHSIHLGGTTAFFLTWLSTFKLLMFAFHKGPLSTPNNISLPTFIALATLPIRVLHQQPQNNGKLTNKSFFLGYAVKVLLFALILKIYDEYEDDIHGKLMLVIYTLHIYLFLDIILAIAAAMARGLLGVELEPQFDEPYLSGSLQDFWGRRWNIMVTRILRPTVYVPVLQWSTDIVGRKWAPAPAVMSTFVVSGLMHELIFYYLGRVKPTWEITSFFLLHGVCLIVEIFVKKAAVNGGRSSWRLPRIVRTILTVGFIMMTAFWLFFPPLLRCKTKERALDEVAAVAAFAQHLLKFNLR